jgi:HK97 family phage major capsid protein
MGAESLAELISEIKKAAEGMADGDVKTNARIDALAKSLDSVLIKINRPGAFAPHNDNNSDFIRKDAIGLCHTRRALTVPKDDGLNTYEPSPTEIDDAIVYRNGLRSLWRAGDPNKLDNVIRKSMSNFSFGTNQFILPPTLASQALSCLVDPTDLTGLVNVVNISGPSIKFMIDNVRINTAAWACESSCFANNPQPDLAQGLGELEIKAENLRFVACATGDLLQDAAFNIESWILRKVSDGFRATISAGIIAGDGLGKPLGLLHPTAGIPILDTSVNTPPGQVSWQDLVMLKWDVPVQWHGEGSYLMNQRTWALIATMSDGIGRPLFTPSPIQDQPGFLLNGSPVNIITQMPECLPGNTPVAFGNWRQTYTLVNRSATTMVPDPYSAGFCTLFRFEARVGGALTCPNAARLLRVR